MRIGFEAKRLFLNNRGLGNYARNLVYGLTKYHPEHNYHLYSPKLSNEHINSNFLKNENITVHQPTSIIGKLSRSAWRSLRLGNVALQDELDAFHGLSQELPKDIKKAKTKTIVTVHDMIFLKHPSFYNPIDRKIYFSKLKFAVQKADHVIAISEQTKKDILNNFAVSETRISVVYQSCNEVFYKERTNEEKKKVKQKWNLPENYLLYVGALNENKNVIAILKALTLLKGKVDLPLVVVGKGDEYKKRLLQFATKNGIVNQLIFASDIANPSPKELSSFYQMASAFIFPSYYEGFGIPILEARFSDIPVIASNSSCLEEAGGENSSYFNPDNMEELADQISNCLITKNYNYAINNQFTLAGSTEKLISIYNSI